MAKKRKKSRGGVAKLMMSLKYSKDQRESWKRKAKAAGLPVGTWLKKLADAAE